VKSIFEIPLYTMQPAKVTDLRELLSWDIWNIHIQNSIYHDDHISACNTMGTWPKSKILDITQNSRIFPVWTTIKSCFINSKAQVCCCTKINNTTSIIICWTNIYVTSTVECNNGQN
jgi:hypothetical protein